MADEKKKAPKKIRAYEKRKFCPKCGPGVKLAKHKGRQACGKCGYFEKV
ncbi:MAG: ribosomal S27a family protein [Candidatus Micrarchaeota archaeon]